MAPDAPSRDRPLRADPLSGSTALLDREPPEVVDGAGTTAARLEAARLASSRPSASLPPLSRRANLVDWARTTGRRRPRRKAGPSRSTTRPSGPASTSTSTSRSTPTTGLVDRLRAWVGDAPVRQLVEGVALCLVGVGLLLGWVIHISWTPLLDVGLVLVGAVLVLQARRSTPARPLIALGAVLAVVAVATWRADVTLDGGAGRRREAPPTARTDPYEYRLGTGQLTIDLRATAITATPLVVDAEVGIGRIVVRVPEDAVVSTVAAAGGGQVLTFGSRHVGPGIDESSEASAPSPKQIRLDLRVGLGSVEVARG